MTQQLKTTALYCRLSKDDERQGESLSIETQKSMLVRYAQENGLLPYEIYVDDGYSGLNFERPSFQRMIDDVAVGKIGVVVVKDLSRFGRDHIVVGQYQEIYFPSKKVRFIALNDGIDTVNSHTTDYAALKNVINEFYSRDTSRKIKAAFRARAKDGKYHAKAAPFGYLKDPNDHNHLIPDPETAPIVAKIYDLVLKGWGNYRIRDYLRETKVPVPSWYQHIRGVEDKSVEVGQKADYYRSKAEAAEKNAAISSDDPEAVKKLKDKLQKLEDFQNRMKKVNAYYRKNGTMKGFENLSDEKAAEIDEAVKNDYSWITAPYAPFQLSNNNAEINRLKKRIATLERREETGFVGWQFEGGEAVANQEENRLQLLFDEKPSEEQRSKLKSWGFKWAPSNKAWQRQLNSNAIYAAGQINFVRPLDGRTPRELQPKPKKKDEQER